jgi:hypothetical protein
METVHWNKRLFSQASGLSAMFMQATSIHRSKTDFCVLTLNGSYSVILQLCKSDHKAYIFPDVSFQMSGCKPPPPPDASVRSQIVLHYRIQYNI